VTHPLLAQTDSNAVWNLPRNQRRALAAFSGGAGERINEEQPRRLRAFVAAPVARRRRQRECLARADHERAATVFEAVGDRAADDVPGMRRLAPVPSARSWRVLNERPARAADVGIAVKHARVVGHRLGSGDVDDARVGHGRGS
jgi:hypothetical protein